MVPPSRRVQQAVRCPEHPPEEELVHRQREHADGEAADAEREEERAQREATNGQKLCETHSDVRSTAEWVKEKTGRFWRDLWTFMYKLDAWLDKDAPAGTREKVDALAADDAFAQATAWPALLSNS